MNGEESLRTGYIRYLYIYNIHMKEKKNKKTNIYNNLKINENRIEPFVKKLGEISFNIKHAHLEFTFNASSWLMAVNGVPFTSSIESPGRSPARSATEPSSMRDIYTPTPIMEEIW